MNNYSLFSVFRPIAYYGLIFAAISCLAIRYFVYSRRLAQWRRSNIPFLRPSFLIGHKYFLNLTKNSCLVSLDRIYKENADKDVVGFFLGTMPMILIRKPALIKQVFTKNFDKTFDTGMIGCRDDEVVQNMISLCANKKLWKTNRKTFSPMVNVSRMNGGMFPNVRTQIRRLWAHAETTYHLGKPLSAKEVLINFMVDGFWNNLFSLNTNSYESQEDMHRLITDSLEPSVKNMMRMYAQMQFSVTSMFEFLRIFSKKEVDSMKNLIRQQIKQRTQHPSGESSFVDILMRLQSEETAGKPDSDMDITPQMMGFVFSTAFGMKKTPALICTGWLAMHLLSLHPEHQERIRKEVAEVMQRHKTSEFTYEVIRDLRFTEQCIYESARLFPSGPAITRICSEDFNLPGDNLTFKKGERLIINPYSTHRDPSYFKNPEKFDPDRFSPENIGSMSPDTFLSFGIGPRKCPGEKLGIFMITTMIASLVYKFDINARSHTRQMDATDFSPRIIGNIQSEDLFVDVIPREIIAH